MARSKLREGQVKDADFMSEQEHADAEHLFVSLADTPTTFSGGEGKYIKVKNDGSAIEFVATSDCNLWIEKTTDYVASNDDRIFLTSSGGSFIITLPSSPAIGDVVSFIDGYGYCETNNVTVSGAGQKIMKLDENLIIDTDHAAFDLVFYDAACGWIIK